MISSFNDAQKAELARPLSKQHVTTRSQSGRNLSYLEGWHVIAEANRIFGFDGWTRETVDMREVRPPEMVKSASGKETWRVGFIAKVRVTVGDVVREGTGFGSGALPDLGEAYESAVKEAETDAMKRALMTFGNPFGLALYDKTQANVAEEPSAEDRVADELVKAVKGAASLATLEAITAEPAFKSKWKALGGDARGRVNAAGIERRAALTKSAPLREQLVQSLAVETPVNLLPAG